MLNRYARPLAAVASLLLPSVPAAANECEELHDTMAERYEHAVSARVEPSSKMPELNKLEDEIFEAMESCPNDFNLLKLMGETQIAAGRGPIAIAYGYKLVDMRPDYFAGHLLLGAAFLTVGKTEEGIRHMKEAEELASDNLAVKLNLCSALAQADRKDEAIEYCDTVLAGGDDRLRGIAAALLARLR